MRVSHRQAAAWVALATGLLLTAHPRVACAGNDDEVLLGNTAAMTAGAVVATVDDGSAVWYNPAGIALARRNAVDVNGSSFALQVRDQPGLISLTTGEGSDAGSAHILSIPAALTGVRRLESGLNIAFGIFVPAQSTRALDAHLEHFELDGALGSRLDLGIQEQAQRYHLGGAIGYQVSDNFRFGVSAFVRYQTASYDAQWGAFYEGGGVSALEEGAVRAALIAIGLELGFGVQWAPIPEITFGLSARSPAMEIAWNFETVDISSTAILGSTDPAYPDELSYGSAVEDVWEFGAEASSPLRVTLGVALTLDQLWVSAEFDVQHPLTNSELGLDRELVWNVRVGARYEVDETLGIGFGLFTDNSSSKGVQVLGDERMNFYGGTFGIELQTPHQLGEGEDARTLVFSTTVAVRYAVGVGQAAGLRLDPLTGMTSDPSPVHDSMMHEASLHLGSALYF